MKLGLFIYIIDVLKSKNKVSMCLEFIFLLIPGSLNIIIQNYQEQSK